MSHAALEEPEIERIIQMFVDGARRTKDAGFDGVELHGCARIPPHPVLLASHESPNRQMGRESEKPLLDRLEVVRRIRTEVGGDYPI